MNLHRKCDVLGYGECAISGPAAEALDDRATEYGVVVAQSPPTKQPRTPLAMIPVESQSEHPQWGGQESTG